MQQAVQFQVLWTESYRIWAAVNMMYLCWLKTCTVAVMWRGSGPWWIWRASSYRGLGTCCISDTVRADWLWELAAGPVSSWSPCGTLPARAFQTVELGLWGCACKPKSPQVPVRGGWCPVSNPLWKQRWLQGSRYCTESVPAQPGSGHIHPPHTCPVPLGHLTSPPFSLLIWLCPVCSLYTLCSSVNQDCFITLWSSYLALWFCMLLYIEWCPICFKITDLNCLHIGTF